MTALAPAREKAEAAISQLDGLLDRREGEVHQILTDAVRAAVAIRDELIGHLRQDGSAAEALRKRLQDANLLVSTAVGAQFPVTGVHWDRVEKTRDGLRRMLAD